MAHDVFISYSTKDQRVVEAMSHYLDKNGVRENDKMNNC